MSTQQNHTENEIKILREDDAILALDKPIGIVVNRSDTYTGVTVQDFLEGLNVLVKEGATEQTSDFIARSGIVHRLDKDTSGVLLAAKTQTAFDFLQLQFKQRDVKKEYLAIVIGKVESPQFIVEAPIGRNPKNRLSMAITHDGKPARTEFELIKNFEIDGVKYSALKAFPLTGRTHQIRIHLAGINFPIAGDILYCTKKQYQESFEVFSRTMLHALSIDFTHPETKERVKVNADIPRDFLAYI